MNTTPRDRRTTVRGLRADIDALSAPPPTVSFAAYQAMVATEQDTFDRARLAWFARSLRVETQAQQQAKESLRRTLRFNGYHDAGRRGIILTGRPGQGKTETAFKLAQMVEKQAAKHDPGYRDHGNAPVVWVEPGSHATGKSFATDLIHALQPDIAVPTRWNSDSRRDYALDLLDTYRTQLIVVDEAHHLTQNRTYGTAGDPSGIIKLIQNQSRATFVLTGIDLLGGRGFGTEVGAQVTERCDCIPLAPYGLGFEAGAAAWETLLQSFDESLPLCDHQPGLLVANATPIHQVTHGSIGRVHALVENLLLRIITNPNRTDEILTPEHLREELIYHVATSARQAKFDADTVRTAEGRKLRVA